MDNDTTFLILAGLLILGIIIFGIFRKIRKADLRNDPVTDKETHPNGTVEPQAWFIPRLKGYDKGSIPSPGMPLHPSPSPEGGFELVLPKKGQELDQLFINPGTLAGKSRVIMRGRIEALPDVEFRSVPDQRESSDAVSPAAMTMFIAGKGVDWSGKDAHLRWNHYPTSRKIEVGEFEWVVPLDNGWTDIGNGKSTQAQFEAAKRDCALIGPVFGGNAYSAGHGMFCTGDAKLIVHQFIIE